MKKINKKINEEVLASPDNYYVDVDNNGQMLTVKEFKDAFVNLPSLGYKNPQLNIGPGGKIYGQVNSIFLDEYEGHKFVAITMTPYRTRHIDYSLPEEQHSALTLEQAKQIFNKMPNNYAVLIKSKNFYGSAIHSSDIILTHVQKIQMSESDGFFIRPDTFYHVVQDVSQKNIDLIMQMKQQYK